MVHLALPSFEEACKQMKIHSGIHRMRIMVKTRPCSRVIVIKATDDKVTLTTSLRGLNELKILERVLGEFVGASMAMAPAVAPDASGNEGKSNKNKKGKKGGAGGGGGKK